MEIEVLQTGRGPYKRSPGRDSHLSERSPGRDSHQNSAGTVSTPRSVRP